MKRVEIYTDGSCEGNPGPGGWAAVLICGGHHKEISAGEPATTNNRMELQAAIGALSVLKEPCAVDLYTDSQYVRDGISKWIAGWKVRGWVTRDKQPVKNCDLWKELDAATRPHRVTWKWLRGHSGHEWNERCDVLARQQSSSMRSGRTPAEMRTLLAAFESSRRGAASGGSVQEGFGLD